MNLFKKITIAAMAGSLILCGCGGEEKVVDEKKPRVEKKEKISRVNLLTGLEDMSKEGVGKRPVAVMVNNVEPAMPQYGIEAADLIFEIPVEGDLTRFMALYADYTKVPVVCPIRSCRYYFPVMSQGFDAFYVHWGMDESIRPYLDPMGVERFDGMIDEYLFSRDESRLNDGYDLEHTAYFDGPKFADVVKDGYRLELNDGYKDPFFKFNKKQKKVSDDACTLVDISFGGQSSTFTYDEENKVYLKQINGNPQIDDKTQNQLAFTNVFVLETSIYNRQDGYHKYVECFGSDTSIGYYISNGTVKQIHWKKDGGEVNSKLKFYDEKGKEIKINKGKTYIAMVNSGQTYFE